ncbi:SH3 domain-containing protein [Candidatus Latescibacterota bacterium]
MKMIIKHIAYSLLFVLLSGIVEGQEVKYEDAPKVVPGSTEEMQHPGFWISNIKGNPNRVFLTPEEIVELNRKNQTKSYEYKDIHGKTYSVRDENTILVEDPFSIKTFPGDKVRNLLESNRKFLESRTFYDFRKRTWDEDMKKDLYDKIDADSISNKIIPQYGIIVNHTQNRTFPTDKRAWTEQNGWIPSFGSVALDVSMPVAILHKSVDRDWYFVRSKISFGWVPAANVAIGSVEELSDYVNAKDFIVSCTYKVPVYSDRGAKIFISDLYMGAKIKLLNNTASGYQVLFPFRKSDGSFEAAPGWVKPDARVSVGYQPFTQRNLINTFFTVLYRPWAGGDSYNERTCNGGTRAVLRTFGIFTIKSCLLQLHASDHVISFPKETPREIKFKYLDGCEPGITFVGFQGHIIMYIGKVNNKYYFIHQTGYDYKLDDGTVKMVRRVNVNDHELQGGSHVDTWTHVTSLKP